MKIVLIYLIMVLADLLYIGSAFWLVLEKGWSVWTIPAFLAFIVIIPVTSPKTFIEALKE